MNDNSEAFLNLYRDLEEVLDARYGKRMGLVQDFAAAEGTRYREELNLFREMRNLLSHHGKIYGEPPAIPSDAAVKKLEEILDFAKNPPLALSVATLRKSLFCADGDDLVTDIIKKMQERGYSHVPVIEQNGHLTGVFSVGTIFAFSGGRPDIPIAGKKISDVSEYLPPECHTTEQYRFVRQDASCEDMKKLFRHNGPYSRRVAALFVTAGGSPTGKLLGMVTPWDLIKAI